MADPKWFLPMFIFFDTCRALLAFGVLRAHIPLPPAQMAFWSELVKWICSIIFLQRWLRNTRSPMSLLSALLPEQEYDRPSPSIWQRYDFRFILSTAAPASLYLANNLLYLFALQFTSPALLNLVILAKLPITAILHYAILGRSRPYLAWVSLVWLCFGLLTLQLPWPSIITHFSDTSSTLSDTVSDQEAPAHGSSFGQLLGALIAVISGLTSIVTESLMKRPVPFWTVQVWLYSYGVLFSFILVLAGIDGVPLAIPHSFSELLGRGSVIFMTAATGLVVANILRKADNLVKLIGGSATVVTSLVLQPLLYPELWSQTFCSPTILAVGVVSVSTWTYNYYKDQQPGSTNIQLPTSPFHTNTHEKQAYSGDYEALALEDHHDRHDENKQSNSLLPSTSTSTSTSANPSLSERSASTSSSVFLKKSHAEETSRMVPTKRKVASVMAVFVTLALLAAFTNSDDTTDPLSAVIAASKHASQSQQ